MDENRIIPFYAHPHVYTKIIDNTFYDETTAMADNDDSLPFATAVVTGADKGIDNTFIRVSDLGTKKVIFGKGDFKKYGQASLQADLLFNGSTDVWFCRVLPDNATYANLIVLCLYRTGNEAVNNAESTMKRMEVKFRAVRCDKNSFADIDPANPVLGATDTDELYEFALTAANAINNPSPESTDEDAKAGYQAVPLFYARSIGRGKYGNVYGLSVVRNSDAEKDYGVKMYNFQLVENGAISKIINVFAGSLYQTTVSNRSTLISDVLSQFATGTCPIDIYPFEDSFDKLYEIYQDIVAENGAAEGATDDDLERVAEAQAITPLTFDPVFGYKMNTRNGEKIPFYKNYTTKPSGKYVAPDANIDTIDELPGDTDAWEGIKGEGKTVIDATVGARVYVAADADHDGVPYIYTVTALVDIEGEETKKTIEYDEGVETEVDAANYDGTDITVTAGINFAGGHDGDFQEITTSHRDDMDRLVVSTVVPNQAQMRLLLAREQVKAFHGEKDRKILSPARTTLDFIFDANYNCIIADDGTDPASGPAYAGATCLTTTDAKQLAAYTGDPLNYSDIDVKQAMYDLVQFRNKNGITQDPELGAGCHLQLDCGLVGYGSANISSELSDLIATYQKFVGRACSIDLGYYDIFDPYTGRRETVTATYKMAEDLVPHLMRYGINKPYTGKFAQLQSVQKNTSYTPPNQMIRDSFRPDIDLIDWDVKEELYTNRFNYWMTTDEGRNVQRAVQNTRQLDASALLEENNVRVLNTLKKGLEAACNSYLFDWNEPTARKGYTDSQMQVYRPWIGTFVQDLDIRFDADEWEQERMIMHCYVVVKFRDIIKRIILQINIERPTYSTEGGE